MRKKGTHKPRPSSTTHDLPPPLRQLIGLRHLLNIDTDHGLTQTLTDLRQHLRILVVGDSLDDSAGALLRIAGLEDTGADEDAIAAQLHHQRRISRRGNTARGEVHNRQTALLGRLPEQGVVAAQLAGIQPQLDLGVDRGLQDSAGLGDVRAHGAHVSDGFDDVSRAGLALGADHGSAFGDAAQGFAEVAAAADEGNLEVMLRDVVDVVCGGEDL